MSCYTGLDFPRDCADKVISIHIQLKCNNDLLLRCVFLNFVMQKYSVFITLESLESLLQKQFFCGIFSSTQFSTWFSSFLKVKQQRYFAYYFYYHIWFGKNFRIILLNTVLFVIINLRLCLNLFGSINF